MFKSLTSSLLLATLCLLAACEVEIADETDTTDTSTNTATETSSNTSTETETGTSTGTDSVTERETTELVNQVTMSASNQDRTVSVTFHFEQNVQLGSFADGSYFVVPASGQSAVTISSLESTGGTVSADENPTHENKALTDGSNNYGDHDASQKLIFPMTFDDNTSIVAAVQKDEQTYGNCGTRQIVGECIDALFALTVLEEVPAKNTLRPAITTTQKDFYTLDDFDFDRIPHIDFFVGSDDPDYPSIAEPRWIQQTEVFSVLRLVEGSAYSEGGRAWRSDIYGGNYGSSTARAYAGDWVNVMSQDLSDPETFDEYEQLISALLVYGKDLYYTIYDGEEQIAGYGSGAGQAHGKILGVAMFSALLKDNQEQQVNLAKLIPSLDKNNAKAPAELEQINLSPNGFLWGDGPGPGLLNSLNVGGYWGAILAHQCFDGASGDFGECDTGRTTGSRTPADPHQKVDGPSYPGSYYYSVSAGPNMIFAAFMALVPEIRALVNAGATGELEGYKDAPILFFNRYLTQGVQTQPDDCAPPDPREDPSTCDAYRSRGCQYYGLNYEVEPTWGPDPADTDWTDGIDCIKAGAGQSGRFPARHGAEIDPGYSLNNIESNWDQIYQIYLEQQ